MIAPPNLEQGDTIVIAAPGGKVLPGELDDAIALIKRFGYKIKLAQNLFSTRHSYLSGLDQERLMDFQKAVDDDNVKAIFCARGGYGTTRIIDRLDWSSFETKPKWIVGFSDITALHLELAKRNIQSVHGIMPKLISKDEDGISTKSLFEVLMNNKYEINATPCPHNRLGTTSGVVIGGNLSLIVESIGTKSEIDFADKILIIEEISEYKYKMDRMLNQLKRAGKLNKLKGLVVGYISEIRDTERPFGETLEEIIFNSVGEYSYPVAFGFPVGHERPNFAWRHGSLMKLTVTEEMVKLTSS